MKSIKIFICILSVYQTSILGQTEYFFSKEKKRFIKSIKHTLLVRLNDYELDSSPENFMMNISTIYDKNKIKKMRTDLYLLDTKAVDTTNLKLNLLKNRNVLSAYPLYKTVLGDTLGAFDEIICKLKPGIEESSIQKLLKKYKAEMIKNLGIFSIIKISKSKHLFKAANEFYESGLFEFAHPNFLTKITFFDHIPNDLYFNKQIAFHNVGQVFTDGHTGKVDADIDGPEAWEITKGNSNIVIAVIDQGVTSNHPDLPNTRQLRLSGSNFAYRYDIVNSDPDDPSPVVNAAHGNACAGVIAATMDNNIGIAGIAPNCKIMPIRISGIATLDDIANSIKFATDNGANIISASWGFRYTDTSFWPAIVEAIEYSLNKSIVVVFAIGNTAHHAQNDPGFIAFPANVSGVISVGATDRYDKLAEYSGISNLSITNQKVDICAPSHKAYPDQITGETLEMWSLDIPEENGYNPWNDPNWSIPYLGDLLPGPSRFDDDYMSYTGRFGGTSHATPVVAGVAALILSINPNLTPPQVFDILTKTADKVGGYYYNTDGWSKELGYGRVNAYAAVVAAQNSLPPAPPVPPDCPDNITLPNTTISSGATETHQASNTIENSTTYIIEDGGTVLLKGNEIILNPGFEAEEGSTFEATVDPCE